MNITFTRVTSPSRASQYMAKQIAAHLTAGKKVLWLISGGSCIATAAATASRLAGQNLSGLTVSLIDERYGEPGHPDSNWHQFEQSGAKLPGATLHPVLAGLDQPATADAFAEFLASQLSSADYSLGLLGIGPDGHTSGILPHSPAVTAPGLACAYDGPDYRRITTAPAALVRLDEAVVYAAGASKWPVLDRLETELPVAVQPAQILKAIPKLTIFTDRPEK
jgi:6-phosphogluconolactonase/glucosamine-6-phosphate isomerase/deaminase